MAANTPSAPAAEPLATAPPYRLRKHLMPIPILASLPAAAALIERSGQETRVLRWMARARALEALGVPCESLAELDRGDELAQPSQCSDHEREDLARLRALVGQTAAVSARIGAGVEDVELRTLCFALARACQRTQSKIRSRQLWCDER